MPSRRRCQVTPNPQFFPTSDLRCVEFGADGHVCVAGAALVVSGGWPLVQELTERAAVTAMVGGVEKGVVGDRQPVTENRHGLSAIRQSVKSAYLRSIVLAPATRTDHAPALPAAHTHVVCTVAATEDVFGVAALRTAVAA